MYSYSRHTVHFCVLLQSSVHIHTLAHTHKAQSRDINIFNSCLNLDTEQSYQTDAATSQPCTSAQQQLSCTVSYIDCFLSLMLRSHKQETIITVFIFMPSKVCLIHISFFLDIFCIHSHMVKNNIKGTASFETSPASLSHSWCRLCQACPPSPLDH